MAGEALAFAEHLADTARPVIAGYFRAGTRETLKADASPVTLADEEAEAAMRAAIADHRPADGILGEETEAKPASAGAGTWVLDPVDGTRAFLAGKPTFATLIGYAAPDGQVLAGVIDQPVTGERWLAAAGGPTHFRGPLPGPAQPVCRQGIPLDQARLATTHPDLFAGQQAGAFAALNQVVGRVDYGGDAYNYACLAMGAVDLVVEAGLKAVDFAALLPIIDGAGGVATDWAGRPLNPLDPPVEGTMLAAGDESLHRAARAYLAPA